METQRASRDVEVTSWRKFRHRAPIDGLRAVAALLVVLFHAGMPGLDNGFVGVDVFFVLSGYLITSLITREHLATGRISLMKFYSRRAKRLFPAALTVLVVTAVAYQLLAPPLDVLENGPGFAFAALYVSNWYFLSRSQDYFAADVSPSPVLHYWSLSVEEQFYLVWPLIVLVLFGIPAVRRKLGPLVLGGLALVGLAASALIAQQNEMLAYFGTIGRAYQLLFGATLAVALLWWQRRREKRSPDPQLSSGQRVVGLLLTTAGIGGLIYSATSLGPESPFLTGVAGTCATVAVLVGIELAPKGALADLLSSPPARHLGRWSYSIYLWHWPIVVLLEITDTLPEEWYVRVPVVVASSILLAAVTWHLIESPVLKLRTNSFSRMRAVVMAGAVATVSTALLTTTILQVPESTHRLAAEITSDSDTSSEGAKIAEDEDVSRTVLIIGDSHAPPWVSALKSYGKDRSVRVVSVVAFGCPWMRVPAIDDKTLKDKGCEASLRTPALEAVREYRPDVTILASRSITVRSLDAKTGPVAPGEDGWSDVASSGISSFLSDLRPLTESVVMIEPIPETESSQPNCLSKGASPSDCDLPPVKNAVAEEASELMRAAATSAGVSSVNLRGIMCPDELCPAMVEGTVTRRDTHHVTKNYAGYLLPQVNEILKKKGVLIG